MGVPRMGHLLDLDTQGTVDKYIMGVLQLLSSCQITPVVDGQAHGMPGDYRLWCGHVYVSRGKFADEEFAQLLKDNYELQIKDCRNNIYRY